MARKKYSEIEITDLLNSQSESDTQQIIDKPLSKLRNRRTLHSLKNRNDNNTESSDSDNTIITRNKNVLQLMEQKDEQQGERVSLRIKLRRSSEQSLYKVEVDSDNDRCIHRTKSKLLQNSTIKENESDEENLTIVKKRLRSTSIKENTLTSPKKSIESKAHESYLNTPKSHKNILKKPRKSSLLKKNWSDEESSTTVLKHQKSTSNNEHISRCQKRNKSERSTESEAQANHSRTSKLRNNVLKQSRRISSAEENESNLETSNTVQKRKKSATTKEPNLTPEKKNNSEKNVGSQAQENDLKTPKSRALKCSNLTPSIRQRSNALLKPATPLQEARSRLHVSAIPKSLPCREEEFNNIFTFLKGKLEDMSGGCIYISGVPGTGKTATVNEVVRCLQKLVIRGQLDDFDYVAINGMKLTEPRQSYVQILKQLTGQTLTWEQAYRTLEKRFNKATSKMTLLLVDELDFLCTKRQDVVYNLLDWPTKASAELVVVTIANTMDLPERVLMGRVTSRLGLTRLTFQPYNYKQLQEIIMTRLKDFDGFRSEAVQLVSRKVFAVSGDARRALDICRRAMEISESRDGETISLQDVTQAVSEMMASEKVQAIRYCSKMEQIFLQSVSAEVTRTAVEEVYFKDAYRQLESLCSFDGVKIPSVTEVLAVCARLGANRLLICEHSRTDIYQKILLNVSTDDIHYALQDLN